MTYEKGTLNYHTSEVETVNDNFVQLYIDKLDLIIEMTDENPTAVKVFTWLLKQMDSRNALVVSQQALAEALEVSRQTVYTAVKYLKEKKAVVILKSGNTNIYAVCNFQINWKSDANNKRASLFNAAVYISDSEQDKPLPDSQLVSHIHPKHDKKNINMNKKQKKSKI